MLPLGSSLAPLPGPDHLERPPAPPGVDDAARTEPVTTGDDPTGAAPPHSAPRPFAAQPAAPLPDKGHKIALENARTICRAARNAGTTVTLDMEDHTTTDSTLSILRDLRRGFPETGRCCRPTCTAPRRTAGRWPTRGSRVRLCKGAYNEPEEVAFQSDLDVDRSYVRCLKVLLAGQGYPMVATHDPRLVEIASTLASRYGRDRGRTSSRRPASDPRSNAGSCRPASGSGSTFPTARSGTAT